MSAEEMLSQYDYCVHYYGSEGRNNILQMLDEYAKQEAIGFAEWRDEYRKKSQSTFAKNFRDTPDNKAAFVKMTAHLNNTDELYTLYQKSKSLQ